MDTASKSTLDNEFGTSKEDECIKQILTKGQVQVTEVRLANTNCGIVANIHTRTLSVVVIVMIPWATASLMDHHDCNGCLKGTMT